MKTCSAALAVLLLITPCFAEINGPIQTESGLVTGVIGRDASVTVFKGIPYAEPPVGNLRWTPPRSLQSWEGVRKAEHFSRSKRLSATSNKMKRSFRLRCPVRG